MRDGSDLHSIDSNVNKESVQLDPEPPLTTKNALLNFYKAQGDPIDEKTADSVLQEYEGKELEMFEEIYGMYNMQMNDNERQTLEGIIGGQKKSPMETMAWRNRCLALLPKRVQEQMWKVSLQKMIRREGCSSLTQALLQIRKKKQFLIT